MLKVLPAVSDKIVPWLISVRPLKPSCALCVPRTVMFDASVRLSPPLLANIRPKSPVPLNNTSAAPPASALKVWLPLKRRSAKLFVLLMKILRPFFRIRPFCTNKVEPLTTVKSISSVTPLMVPELLPARTGTTPPLSEIVPPVITPVLSKRMTPLFVVSASVLPVLLRLPLMLTVPPLLAKPLARLSEAVLKLPPRFMVPFCTSKAPLAVLLQVSPSDNTPPAARSTPSFTQFRPLMFKVPALAITVPLIFKPRDARPSSPPTLPRTVTPGPKVSTSPEFGLVE